MSDRKSIFFLLLFFCFVHTIFPILSPDAVRIVSLTYTDRTDCFGMPSFNTYFDATATIESIQLYWANFLCFFIYYVLHLFDHYLFVYQMWFVYVWVCVFFSQVKVVKFIEMCCGITQFTADKMLRILDPNTYALRTHIHTEIYCLHLNASPLPFWLDLHLST